MNHDYAHCSDYCKRCPDSCFRAQLAKDLKNWPYPVTMASLKYTSYCPKWPDTKEDSV